MSPTKVKIYGLLNVTKKQYIVIQTIIFSITIGVFILSFFYNLDRWLYTNAKISLFILFLLESIETFFVLKKFKKKEELNHNHNI